MFAIGTDSENADDIIRHFVRRFVYRIEFDVEYIIFSIYRRRVFGISLPAVTVVRS